MILDIIAAYLGYRRWGGWRGALKGILILWLCYFILGVIVYTFIFFGNQVQIIR